MLLSIICVIVIGLLLGGIVDSLYVKPVASDKANDECKLLGFDQYKSYSRVGIFSTNPVGIKCEYAERYTDLGVRTNV